MPVDPNLVHFGSGPAALPGPVLQAAAAALLDYKSTGLGLVEHSHRSQHAQELLDQTRTDLATVLGFDLDTWEVLLMQGGGHAQFAAAPYAAAVAWLQRARAAGIEAEDELKTRASDQFRVDYIVSGRWSEKAAKEAKRLLGEDRVNIAANSRDEQGNWRSVPAEASWKLSPDPTMIYYCDNETVDGVEFPSFPAVLEGKAAETEKRGDGPLIVADMSSNILTRAIPFENLSIVFFGAQKNLGITGLTVVLVRKSVLAPGPEDPAMMRAIGLPVPPSIMSYGITAKHKSLYNTLSLLDVFVADQMLKHLLAAHPDRIAGLEAWTNAKATLVYDAIAAHPDRYAVIPDRACRSRTSICWRVVGSRGGESDDEGTKAFLTGAESRGMSGLKGHRAMGGLRAGNFNGVSEEGIRRLVGWMADFARPSPSTDNAAT